MARPKKYIIKLSDDEITTLQRTIRNKATCKTVLKRCQILLELDENHGTGLTHAQIANSYAVCPATITNTIQSYVKNGITDIIKYFWRRGAGLKLKHRSAEKPSGES